MKITIDTFQIKIQDNKNQLSNKNQLKMKLRITGTAIIAIKQSVTSYWLCGERVTTS